MRYANNIHRFGRLRATSLRLVGVCAGLLCLGWSCQRNPGPYVELEDVALNVAPSFSSVENPSNSAPRSKADPVPAPEQFAADDSVGVYLVYYDKAGNARALSDVKADSANMRYRATSTGALTRIAPDKPIYYAKINPAKIDLYAYFPYKPKLAVADLETYEFTVQNNQNKAKDDQKNKKEGWAVDSSDLRWAREQGVTPTAAPVKMTFYHKFSKITLLIKVPKSLSGGRTVAGLANTKLHGIVPTAVLKMSTGDIKLAPNAVPVSITPFAGEPVKTDATWNVYPFEVIIPAQTIEARSAIVGFQVLTNGAAENLTFYAPSNLFGNHKLTSQPGKQYEWTVTVGSSGADGGRIEAKLDGSSIKKWEEKPDTEGALTNSITTRFSLKDAKITAAVNRVKVTTNESATVYDITTGVTVDNEATKTCSFSFTRLSSSPRDYGFSITKLEFLQTVKDKDDVLIHTWTGPSARVYDPTSMTL